MFEEIKETFNQIKNDPPGERFVMQYKRRQSGRKSLFKRILFVGGGLIIALAGVFFLPAPGPGTLIIFLGLGLVGQESVYVARFLDWLEMFLRKLYEWAKKKWDNVSAFLKVLIILLVAILGLSALYIAYLIFVSYK